MTEIIVGTWGKSLAIRVPLDVVRASGLNDGETVEIEALDGDILIRRPALRRKRVEEARLAVAEIMADRDRQPMDIASILELRDEGRRE